MIVYVYIDVHHNKLPSISTQRLWFGSNQQLNTHIRAHYESDLINYLHEKNNDIQHGSYLQLENTPYGALALNILLSELTPRIIQHAKQYNNTIKTTLTDNYDIDDIEQLKEDSTLLCELSLSQEYDKQVSPIERLFFITPLIHYNTSYTLLSAESICNDYIQQLPYYAKPYYRHILQYIKKQQDIVKQNEIDSKDMLKQIELDNNQQLQDLDNDNIDDQTDVLQHINNKNDSHNETDETIVKT